MLEYPITKRQADNIHKLIDRLIPLANSLDPEPLCWIGDHDDGEDFCWDCAEKRVAEINKTAPKFPAFVDGGWSESLEKDGHAACATCGKTLQHSLTQWALCNEVEYFTTSGYGFHSPTTDEVAYAVTNILNAAEWADRLDVIDDAIKIGRQAVANLPKRA